MIISRGEGEMKTRNGFISNSSSSSFVIQKRDLTDIQIEQIRNHIEEGKKIVEQDPNAFWENDCGFEAYDEWEIKESWTEIDGYTTMDNFDMETFLKKIGVPEDKVEWGDW